MIYYLQNKRLDRSTDNKFDDINNDVPDVANILLQYSNRPVDPTQSTTQQTNLFVAPSNKNIISANTQELEQEQYKLSSNDDLPWDNYSLYGTDVQLNNKPNNKQNNEPNTNVTIYEIY